MRPLIDTPSTDGITNATVTQATLRTSRASFPKSHKRELLRPLTERARQDRCAKKPPGEGAKWAFYPLAETHITAHLDGTMGCGIGLMDPGQSTTRTALFDLDAHNGETSFDDMLQAADSLCAALKAIGLRPTAFRSSGGSGVHIWMIWDTPQDAHSVRHALIGVLAGVGLSPGSAGVVKGQVEVFPKQSFLTDEGPGSNGNMAVLPFWNKSGLLVDEFGLGLAIATPESAPGVAWRASDPVPHIVNPAPARVQGERAAPDPLDKIARALAAVAPLADKLSDKSSATDYDTWLNILYATHDASGGTEEGFDLFKEWHDLNPANVAGREARRVWDQCTPAHVNPVTRSTLYAMAGKCNPEWGALTPAEQTVGFDDVLPDMAPTLNMPEQLPAFKRHKTGEILATKNNLMQALARPDICGFQLRDDTFRGEVMLAENGTEGWRSLKDTDYVEIPIRLERGGFQNITKELIRGGIAHVAEANAFDTAQHWIVALPWDGVSRIERFMQVYFGAEDTPYTRAVGRYFWTAAAGRVIQPGVKCDMVPVAVGAQGMRKSTAVASLVPDHDFYIAIDLGGKDDDLARLMRGKLIIELDELKGLGTRDSEHIKSFISRTYEEWIPKFREMNTRYRRRSVFFGTSNKDDFLADETGNRRWLPFKCGMCDPEAIERDREQLWAEARELFKADGVLHRDAELLAKAEHESFVETDEWDNAVHDWLHQPDFITGRTPYGREFLTSRDVLKEVFQISDAQQTRAHMLRVKKVLIRLDYTYDNKRVHGVKTRGFVPPSLF